MDILLRKFTVNVTVSTASEANRPRARIHSSIDSVGLVCDRIRRKLNAAPKFTPISTIQLYSAAERLPKSVL